WVAWLAYRHGQHMPSEKYPQGGRPESDAADTHRVLAELRAELARHRARTMPSPEAPDRPAPRELAQPRSRKPLADQRRISQARVLITLVGGFVGGACIAGIMEGEGHETIPFGSPLMIALMSMSTVVILFAQVW